MKSSIRRGAAVIILLVCLLGVVLADFDSLYSYGAMHDWFAKQSSEEAFIPDRLDAREEAIYRAAYANGFYDALHPAYIEGLYMLNTKTRKFHLTNCSSTLTIETHNRKYSDKTPEELIADGYKPCGQCHPDREAEWPDTPDEAEP